MFSTLIVEDNETFRHLLSDTLHRRFPAIGIEESSDGADAMRKVRYLHPDFILMDIRLPGQNGLEMTKRIKQVNDHVVIVILTGHDLPEYRQQAFRNGADCFISKCSDSCMEDLLARIEGAMTTGRQRH